MGYAMKSNFAGKGRQWLFAIVPAAVLLEIFLQWRIPGDIPDDDEWLRAAESIRAQKASADLVIISPEWADQGRMFLGELMTFKDFGRFDTTRYSRIFEVSAYGAMAPETREMEPVSRESFGRIEVRTYKLSRNAEVLYDFRDHVKDAIFEGTARVSPKIMVDREFHPRYALPVSLKKGGGVLIFKNVPLHGVLRGYGFLDYREARYNKGQPVAFRIYIDGKLVSEQNIANFDTIKPFLIDRKHNDTGEVRFEIVAKDNLEREFGFTCDVRRSPQS